MSKTISPAEIAERYHVGLNKVLEWIRTGELVAINVARSADTQRPRWRVPIEALADFERRRSAVVGGGQ